MFPPIERLTSERFKIYCEHLFLLTFCCCRSLLSLLLGGPSWPSVALIPAFVVGVSSSP